MKTKMPEPTCYLYRIRHYDGSTVLVSTLPANVKVLETIPLITTEQAEAYAQAVRDEAVRRSRPTYFSDGYQAGWNSALDKAADLVGGSSMTSRHAAAAIRALKREQS